MSEFNPEIKREQDRFNQTQLILRLREIENLFKPIYDEGGPHDLYDLNEEKNDHDNKTLDIDQIAQRVQQHYENILPIFKSKNLVEIKKEVTEYWLDSDLKYYKRCILILDALTDFARNHIVTTATINETKPLDEDMIGSTARVFEFTLPDGLTGAAKVMYDTDLYSSTVAFKEGLHLAVAGALGVGPRFHGYQITDSGQVALLMDRVDALEFYSAKLKADLGVRFVNEKTISTFEEKMAKLHLAGFTFDGDEGQCLISEDGAVHFIDILLTPLENGMYVTDMGKKRKIKPTETGWYRRKINHFRDLIEENKTKQTT